MCYLLFGGVNLAGTASYQLSKKILSTKLLKEFRTFRELETHMHDLEFECSKMGKYGVKESVIHRNFPAVLCRNKNSVYKF